MSHFIGSRRRRVLGAVAATFIAATTAFAYWLLTDVIGQGEGSNKVAKGTQTIETVPLNISFAELKGPGQPTPLAISVAEGSLKAPMEIDRVIVSFTNSRESEGCENTWFALSHLSKEPLRYGGKEVGTEAELFGAGLAHPIIIKTGEDGEYQFSGSGAEVELRDEPEVFQGACEGATLYVHARTEV
ncbi:MAG TPA: hypothetical protein VL979_02890 [Solirubrobacteraceae bacterium]|nr:hypothetical protein [Solirubrobacteraceae bacterium]